MPSLDQGLCKQGDMGKEFLVKKFQPITCWTQNQNNFNQKEKKENNRKIKNGEQIIYFKSMVKF